MQAYRVSSQKEAHSARCPHSAPVAVRDVESCESCTRQHVAPTLPGLTVVAGSSEAQYADGPIAPLLRSCDTLDTLFND
jgi:hypothetical protein